MNLALALLGPTASGKSQFAIELAQKLNGEIICLDSTTVYKGFNIGTAKPTPLDQKKVKHHLIDILEPQDPFNAFDFMKKADQAITQVQSQKKIPILVGGSYFYFRSLENGMLDVPPVPESILFELNEKYPESTSLHAALLEVDPPSAKKIHPHDRYRLLRALGIYQNLKKQASQISLSFVSEEQKNRLWMKYALVGSRTDITQNILLRTDQMLSQGLIEETQNLLEKYPDAKSLGSIGYAECVRFIKKELTRQQLRNEIIEKTRQLAKRQMTWLRSDVAIRFIDSLDGERVLLEVNNLKFVLEASCSL